MAQKKSFKNENPAMSFIGTRTADLQEVHAPQQAQEKQEPHATQEEHEEHGTQEPLYKTTQGKKGQKLPRINMAFSPVNLEYLQIISRIEGVSSTEYVNRLIDADRDGRKEVIEAARKLLK